MKQAKLQQHGKSSLLHLSYFFIIINFYIEPTSYQVNALSVINKTDRQV